MHLVCLIQLDQARHIYMWLKVFLSGTIWYWQRPLGEKMENEDLGEKTKRGKKKGEKISKKNWLKDNKITSFCRKDLSR